MKLRSLRLSNVKRFVAPVEITGFGAGLNLLTAPNEAGKSTIFAALNAVFFAKSRSWDKATKALQPYAGGDPHVAAEIETPDGVFTISKTWSSVASRKDARVMQGARLVAQSDAAEAWIADLMRAPGDGGPAGLLWVRQGLVALDDDKDAAATRRGILSSVTGEVEAMTGGRRMDAALAQVNDALGVFVTSRGPKRGGPLDQAETALADLAAQEASLSDKARGLRIALDRRRSLRFELKGLEDPVVASDRQTQLRSAEAALDAAQRYAERLSTVRAEADRATALRQSTAQMIDGLEHALAEQTAAVIGFAEAQKQLAASQDALDHATEAAQQAERAAQAARTTQAAAETTLREVDLAEAAVTAAALRAELQARIKRGEGQEQDLAASALAAQTGPDAAALAQIEGLHDALARAEMARDAAAPVISVRYDGGAARIRLHDTALDEGARKPLPERTELAIDGVGRLVIEPGRREDASQLVSAKDALAAALRAQGFDTVDAARRAAQDRHNAQTQHAALSRAFAAEFPDGLGPLRTRLAALPDARNSPSELPDRDEAEGAVAAAQAVLATAAGHAASAKLALADARRSADQWIEKQASARDRLDRANIALVRFPDPAEALSAAQQQLDTERANEAAALEKRSLLERDAPDPDAAQTRVARLREAAVQTARRLASLREDLAGLEGQIGSAADAGVDEELADVSRRRAATEARRDALLFEVAVLQRLRDALDQARASARDTYVAPVKAELRPLLAQFMPGAELALDADAVLPSDLTRDGQLEPVEGLSGGTREQLALLVRLAFARMLEKAGRAAPVILDDAIVFTDDERIERMFDALTHQARDLQIIVFSCRQSAFRTLPANILTVTEVAED